MQHFFNPLDTEHFSWTNDGWYTFDRDAAHKAARRQRDQLAKELKDKGRKVSKLTLSNQLINRGGIGSGKPQVDFVVSVYGLDAF